MALPTSGQLTFEQVGTELSISTGGPHSLRSMSSLASKSVPDSLEEFYGYSASTPITPTKCSVSYNSGFIRAIWFCNGANDACQGRYSINGGAFTSWADRTSPWNLIFCSTNNEYDVEIRGRIGTTYSTPCYPATFDSGNCP